MIIAAIFTIAKWWNLSRCPITNEWVKNMAYIHNGVFLSHKQ
jgi:hypothetical protein